MLHEFRGLYSFSGTANMTVEHLIREYVEMEKPLNSWKCLSQRNQRNNLTRCYAKTP
jgi:hypothetical protein